MLNRILLTLGLALTLTACADKDSVDDSGGGGGGDESENGADVFASNCAVCHGADGSGTPSSDNADLNDRVPSLSNADLRDVIENGKSGTGMPDLGLNSSEVDAVFDYLRDEFGDEGGG